jgi:uncharacterized protein
VTVFVDTSAFMAILDADESRHAPAREAWKELLSADTPLATTNYVLLETFALLQHRFGLKAVRLFQEDVVPVLHVEYVSPELHRAGVSALLAASRRRLSLVDCISFECLRSLGIRTVFAFDPHFAEQGFRVIP